MRKCDESDSFNSCPRNRLISISRNSLTEVIVPSRMFLLSGTLSEVTIAIGTEIKFSALTAQVYSLISKLLWEKEERKIISPPFTWESSYKLIVRDWFGGSVIFCESLAKFWLCFIYRRIRKLHSSSFSTTMSSSELSSALSLRMVRRHAITIFIRHLREWLPVLEPP